MILTGQQKEILKEGIIGAYPTEDELKILLSEKMDLRYSAIAKGEDYISRVAFLVEKLEADGEVEHLIRVVVKKKPNSPYLKQVKTEFANVNNAKIASQLFSKETLPVDMSFSDDSQGTTIGNYTPNAQGSTIISGGNFSGVTLIGTQINQPRPLPPGLTLNRQAALVSAQTTAMLIVDLMRMLYVISNHEARLVNMSRYSVFVDVTDNHLSEMRSQAARFATQMPSDFLNLSAEIERNCAWVYGQLKGPPDVTQDIDRCYKIMHRTASLTFKFCLDAIPEIFSTVVRDVDDAMTTLSLPESPKNVDLFRIRLNAQTQLLDNLKINPDNIRTIAHDVSQQFALHYFVIDYQLLNAIQPAE